MPAPFGLAACPSIAYCWMGLPREATSICIVPWFSTTLQKLANLIDCQLVNESSFPHKRRFVSYPRGPFGSRNSQGTVDRHIQWEPKNNEHFPSIVASDYIVPVDTEDNEEIYKYALSVVDEKNNGIYGRSQYVFTKVNQIFLEKVLCASKLEVTDSFCYSLLLKVKDDNEVCNTHCAIIDKHERVLFFSKPLQEYKA